MSNIFKRIVGPLHLIVISLLLLSSVILNLKQKIPCKTPAVQIF